MRGRARIFARFVARRISQFPGWCSSHWYTVRIGIEAIILAKNKQPTRRTQKSSCGREQQQQQSSDFDFIAAIRKQKRRWGTAKSDRVVCFSCNLIGEEGWESSALYHVTTRRNSGSKQWKAYICLFLLLESLVRRERGDEIGWECFVKNASSCIAHRRFRSVAGYVVVTWKDSTVSCQGSSIRSGHHGRKCNCLLCLCNLHWTYGTSSTLYVLSSLVWRRWDQGIRRCTNETIGVNHHCDAYWERTRSNTRNAMASRRNYCATDSRVTQPIRTAHYQLFNDLVIPFGHWFLSWYSTYLIFTFLFHSY